ncbi:conserved hypothetical protein [Flavobacterium sp. 9AF]|uniref:hypothetical protein n=1 Tax=Flavobacterium sp. 9AF TaxID=2653142 RepID=UPI0012F226CC|nr:hypothetical protein [Flavobacterium sp. 9AF]VXB30760.1 conserved hypothetical protein [Flavobacterium sp. 9AF]
MIYLELRVNEARFEEGWNFSESVWAPTKKANGSSWPYWSLVGKITKGDLIFHLRQVNGHKSFVGFSTAATDGYITKQGFTDRHIWSYSNEFYKADLIDYQEFNPAIPLKEYFSTHNDELRNYFIQNKKLSTNDKKRLFYVIQRNILQCQNGAYLSEFDFSLAFQLKNELSNIRQNIKVKVDTDVVIKELTQRIGHQEFSENVKANFSYKCCFPNCKVEGKGFLISGHIDRWADNEELRGNTDNGLCFCLMHDKAFEKGFFTLDEKYKIKLLKNKFEQKSWLLDLLQNGEGIEISPRIIDPSIKALKSHWKRIGYNFK